MGPQLRSYPEPGYRNLAAALPLLWKKPSRLVSIRARPSVVPIRITKEDGLQPPQTLPGTEAQFPREIRPVLALRTGRLLRLSLRLGVRHGLLLLRRLPWLRLLFVLLFQLFCSVLLL